jgi:hypothetical protein
MATPYADQAAKTLTKAVPTVDLDGKVIKWEIEVEYSLNDYVSKFNKQADVEAAKAPGEFTKLELLELANTAHLDLVYDSQYESTQVNQPVTETKVDDFDVDSLA